MDLDVEVSTSPHVNHVLAMLQALFSCRGFLVSRIPVGAACKASAKAASE